MSGGVDGASTELPIFGYVNDADQVEDLRAYFVGCGATGLEKVPSDVPSAVLALARQVRAVGSGGGDTPSIGHVLNSLASLVVPLPSKTEEVVRALCEGLRDRSVFDGEGLHSKAYAAFCVLSNLFHGLQGPASTMPQLRVLCYKAMLEIAGQASFMEELPTELGQVREWFKEWELPVSQQRECLRLIHSGLANKGSKDSAAVMVELLSTYTDKDAESAAQDAYNCVLSAVRDPKTFLYDHLLILNPVKALQRTHPPLYSLLNILVYGSLKEATAWLAKEKTFMASAGLDEAALLHKIRILSLMSLAETRTQVPLTELAETLELSPGQELEDFIIQASLSQAVRGRIDQVQGHLIILGAESRLFEKKEWEALKGKLAQWASSLQALNATLTQAMA